MEHNQEFSTTLPNCKIFCKLSSEAIEMELESSVTNDIYIARYTDTNLPERIAGIFDDILGLYDYISMKTNNPLRFENDVLLIQVNILGKKKELPLNLEKVEISPEEKERRKISKLADTNKWLQEKLQEEQHKNTTLSKTNKILQEENTQLKLQMRLMKENPEHVVALRKPEIVDNGSLLGKKFVVHIDLKHDYINRFRIAGDVVEKVDENNVTHQFTSEHMFPNVGRYYFSMKAIHMVDNTIRIGIMSESCRKQQYSGNRNKCICYSGNGAYIYEETKSRQVQLKPNINDILTISLDADKFEVTFYINDTVVATVTLPETMRLEPLYPYFDMYCVGTKVMLNV